MAKPNHGGHSRNWNIPGGNNLVADQSIKQGGFAPLELTDTCYIETSFGNPCRELACFLGYRLSPKFLG
jgi:hypothetical protein